MTNKKELSTVTNKNEEVRVEDMNGFKIRSIVRDGVRYYVARDISLFQGYKHGKQFIQLLGEKLIPFKRYKLDTGYGFKTTNFITEKDIILHGFLAKKKDLTMKVDKSMIESKAKLTEKAIRNRLTSESMIPVEDEEWKLSRTDTRQDHLNLEESIIKSREADNKTSHKGALIRMSELLNTLVFGKTSKQWKKSNETEANSGFNQRDYATTEQLVLLNKLQVIAITLEDLGLDFKAIVETLKVRAEFYKKLLKNPSKAITSDKKAKVKKLSK